MTKRCTALFHHGWADWEAGFVLAALREYFGFEVRIATPEAASVTSIGGVRAAADVAFADVDPAGLDLLLVIGSERWAEEENPEVVDLLKRANAAGKPIGAICAGTLAAARAGLLDSRAHTSNALDFLRAKAAGYDGATRYVDTPRAVSDGGVVTAPGSAPGSFSVEVLRLAVPDQGEAIDGYAAMLAAEHGGEEWSPPRRGHAPLCPSSHGEIFAGRIRSLKDRAPRGRARRAGGSSLTDLSRPARWLA